MFKLREDPGSNTSVVYVNHGGIDIVKKHVKYLLVVVSSREVFDMVCYKVNTYAGFSKVNT